jgi:colicin import membrane protein
MEALLVNPGYDKSLEQKWSRMIILSLVLHLAVFSTVFLVPESMGTRKIREVVYHVDLVEMPKGKRAGIRSKAQATKGKGMTAPAKAAPTKRISRAKKKEKPVVIAKRTVKVETKKTKPPEVSSAKLLDETLARIERKIQEDKMEPVDQVIPRLEADTEEIPGTEATGRFATDGIIMEIYKADIKDWVCSNWSYPVALLGPNSKRLLSTVVELKVEKNGTILRTVVTQSSGNEGFDQSVLKALKRSDPLPPFPEGYRKTHEEIEINFNLSDLKNQ